MDLMKVCVFLMLLFCLLCHSNGAVNKDFEQYQRTSGNGSLAMENEVKAAAQCNLFRGLWVHDDSYPLYEAAQCPYIDLKFDCIKNGRPDSDYQKWRWQPYGCSMPRFNARDMLERLRGKRLMFAGDSTSRNQWQSMVCLLSTVIPNSKRSYTDGFPLKTFKALDYEASIEYLWAPFLVDFNTNQQGKKILHLDSIEKNGAYWKGVNILVFESSHWWTHNGSDKAWDLIQIRNRLYSVMDPLKGYKRALNTWATWVSENIDPKESTVFTRTMSPQHYSPDKSKNCYKQLAPFKQIGDLPAIPPQVPMLEYVLMKKKAHINLQYIIKLSGYRVDAHPSVYTSELTQQQLKNPEANSDCSHWCLPGLPDTWNELLYASLVQPA